MSRIKRRGIVLAPDDFSLDWVAMAKDSGLNVLGLHMQQQRNDLLPFLESEKGRNIIERAVKLGMDVECEIHAVSLLLPREYFEEHPDWFRMDMTGSRNPDGNFCPASRDALACVCDNARELAGRLVSTTHRYFLWPDDGKLWCHCPECSRLSDSDQNVLVMNHILAALRDADPEATLACLCYHETLAPPNQVKPVQGLFAEWAPIGRCYTHSIDDPNCAHNAKHLAGLRSLFEIFEPAEAQVLEYWMDASKFSRWKRPAAKLPFVPEIMKSDVACYASLGIESITSFGCFLDADYVSAHGQPPVREYGAILANAGEGGS